VPFWHFYGQHLSFYGVLSTFEGMYLSFYGAISSFETVYLSFYGGQNEFGATYLSFYDDLLTFGGVLGVVSVSPGAPAGEGAAEGGLGGAGSACGDTRRGRSIPSHPETSPATSVELSDDRVPGWIPAPRTM